jgi:hypothetical protein
VMKSMWWFVSSSFSKSTGFSLKPARDAGDGKEATIESMSSSITHQRGSFHNYRHHARESSE